MSAMKNLHQDLTDAGIDTEKWADASAAASDFTDYVLAMDVAEALGYPDDRFTVAELLTEAQKDSALETARTRWPSL